MHCVGNSRPPGRSTRNWGQTLGPKNPQMEALQDQIDELTKAINAEQSRLETQAKETYLAAKATEDKTEQELDARKAEAYKQGDDLVQYTVVQREYEQDRTLYEGLEQRLETAKVESGLDASEVDQVDKALPPVDPTMRSAEGDSRYLHVLLPAGRYCVAFIIESLDTGLHNIQEIEAVMEMPSLAIIPKAKRASPEQMAAMSAVQRNITVLTQPKSQFTESFRSLRTSLLLATAGQPPKFILFTSATPSEGKTTIASNLACILAQGETRVLLIDADLRRPNVHHRFGLTGKLGLTTVLAGASTFDEAVQHLAELPNLDILPSGPVPPFPTEMLSSEAMLTLLEKLGRQYTYIVIDSPPILSVTDAAILGRVVDAVVLVIRHGKSSKNVMRRARDLMIRSGAPVAGLVLNAVDLNSPEYYGYYGYTGYSVRVRGRQTPGRLSPRSKWALRRRRSDDQLLSDVYPLGAVPLRLCRGCILLGRRRDAPGTDERTCRRQSASPAVQAATSSTTPLGNQSMLYPGEDFQLAPGDLLMVRVFLQPEYTCDRACGPRRHRGTALYRQRGTAGTNGTCGPDPDRGSPASRRVLSRPRGHHPGA